MTDNQIYSNEKIGLLFSLVELKILSQSHDLMSRYIYVAYAADLVSGGEKLLNILIGVTVAIFSLQWIMVYPVVGQATH